MPTLAALAHRQAIGWPTVYPDDDLRYCSYRGICPQMTVRITERDYGVHPVLEKALEALFILHADPEQNCATKATRSVGSSEVDPGGDRPGGPRPQGQRT